MPRELKIAIPDEKLTAADVVGRAIRIARLNWLVLIRFFLIPTFLSDLAATILVWEPESIDPNFSPTIGYWLRAIAFILIGVTTWELGVRRFALLLFIADGTVSLEESLKIAKKKIWLILILIIPVMITEIGTGFFFLLMQFVINATHHSTMPEPVHVYFFLFMMFLMFALMLPTLSVWVVNSFFLSILVFENANLKETISRFFRLGSPKFTYFCAYTTLMAWAYVSVFFPSIVTASISFFLPTSIVSSIFDFILTAAIETPIYCFLTAAVTIGGACVYKQLCAQLEAQDILDKLKAGATRQVV